MDTEFAPAGLVNKNGVWFAESHQKISYPEEGNAKCLQIEADSFWFSHRNECIVELLRAFPPDGHFFDVGGGNGYVAMGLEKAGFKTVLVEPGEIGAWNAQKRGLERVICATLEHAGFAPSTLPAIGLFDVVEHIEDDCAFLKQAWAMLKPGGRVFISVPAYRWLWSKEDGDAGHFRRYTLSSLGSALRQAGFSVRFQTYIFSFLPLPILLFRTLPSLLGLHANSNDLDKHKKEHQNQGGVLKKMLNNVLGWEIRKIQKRQPLPFGGSCLVVAEKPSA